MQSERVAFIHGRQSLAAAARMVEEAHRQAQERQEIVIVSQQTQTEDPTEEGLTRQQRRYRERQLAKARKAITNV